MLRTYLHTPIFAVGLQLYDDHTNIPSAQPTKVGQSILINFVDFAKNTGNLRLNGLIKKVVASNASKGREFSLSMRLISKIHAHFQTSH